MKRATFLPFLSIIVLSSCGASEEEKKVIEQNARQALIFQQEMQKQREQDSILAHEEFMAEQEGLKNILSELQAELDMEKEALLKTKEWKLLRTEQEKEAELKLHYDKINEIENRIIEIRGKIK